MRISDWSADVCSSDLIGAQAITMTLCGLWHGANWTFLLWGIWHGAGLFGNLLWSRTGRQLPAPLPWAVTMLFVLFGWVPFREIGRSSCCERVCEYVCFSMVAVSLKQTNIKK